LVGPIGADEAGMSDRWVKDEIGGSACEMSVKMTSLAIGLSLDDGWANLSYAISVISTIMWPFWGIKGFSFNTRKRIRNALGVLRWEICAPCVRVPSALAERMRCRWGGWRPGAARVQRRARQHAPTRRRSPQTSHAPPHGPVAPAPPVVCVAGQDRPPRAHAERDAAGTLRERARTVRTLLVKHLSLLSAHRPRRRADDGTHK